jgi:hypothetical protein
MESRAEIEARRGIERDSSGHIIRSKDWLKQRIKTLNAKLSDLDQRQENIKVEIAERTAELKTAK